MHVAIAPTTTKTSVSRPMSNAPTLPVVNSNAKRLKPLKENLSGPTTTTMTTAIKIDTLENKKTYKPKKNRTGQDRRQEIEQMGFLKSIDVIFFLFFLFARFE